MSIFPKTPKGHLITFCYIEPTEEFALQWSMYRCF